VVFGYTALGKAADYRGAAVDASFYALNYARHRLTAALTVRLGREFEIRVDNAARWQANNLLRVTGGDQALATAVGVLYRPRALTGFEFSARVDNAWDDRFQEVPAVPASRRQASMAVGYTW
jgi:vitamin B12 transporter